MKKILLCCALMGVIATSCQKIDVGDADAESASDVAKPSKSFTFHVKGDFERSFEEMTRAATRLENGNTAGIVDLWVLDYVGGALVQSVHQGSTQEGITFCSVPMNLTYGHHDIKFVASKGTEPSLTASALSWGRVKDTFMLDYPVDVVASSNGNRAPELKRAISALKVVISDAIPADAKTIVLTLGKKVAEPYAASVECAALQRE